MPEARWAANNTDVLKQPSNIPIPNTATFLDWHRFMVHNVSANSSLLAYDVNQSRSEVRVFIRLKVADLY